MFIIVKIQAIAITNYNRVHLVRIPKVLSAKWFFLMPQDLERGKSAHQFESGAFIQYWRRLALCSARWLWDAWSSEIFIQQIFSTKREEMRDYIQTNRTVAPESAYRKIVATPTEIGCWEPQKLAPCLELVSDIYSLSEDQQRSLWTGDQVWIMWEYILPFTKVAGFNKVQMKLS